MAEAGTVNLATFPVDRTVEEVACIQLYSELRSQRLDHTPGFRMGDPCRQNQTTGILMVLEIVVVAATEPDSTSVHKHSALSPIGDCEVFPRAEQ
jgi:hypothetical protein